jgi:hypothetical protein
VPLGRRELEPIQFLLGHASVQTTERYLGCKQRIRQGVSDRVDIGAQAAGQSLARSQDVMGCSHQLQGGINGRLRVKSCALTPEHPKVFAPRADAIAILGSQHE